MKLTECKETEKYLRIRGIPESFKNTKKEIIAIIAEFLEIESEKIEDQIDVVYRVNSTYAQKRNLPRDIIVQLTTKSLRDQILNKHFEHPLILEGTKILIMKELPKSVLQERKKYKKLVDNLKDKKLRFRWELPEGLSFTYNSERIKIRNVEEMTNFMDDKWSDSDGKDESGDVNKYG